MRFGLSNVKSSLLKCRLLLHAAAHSCRAVRSEAGKPRGAIQGRYPNEETKNGGFPTQYYYKSSLHSVPQSAGCFCADYQIRCSQ